MSIASLPVGGRLRGLFGRGRATLCDLHRLRRRIGVPPLIAWATAGAITSRVREAADENASRCAGAHPQPAASAARNTRIEDMAHCPAYRDAICSLCCTLDARCDDLCKPQARLAAQWAALLRTRSARAGSALLGGGPGALPSADGGCGAVSGPASGPALLPGGAGPGRGRLRADPFSETPTCGRSRSFCWCPASSPGGWC